MKIFKGDMSLWKQLTDGKAMKAPGGMADVSSYRSALFSAIDGLLGYFIFWNADAAIDNFSVWIKNPKSWFFPTTPWNLLEPAVRRHHFYAYAFLIFCSILSLLICCRIWFTRRRARKSAKGQWYDKPGLTKDDLYGNPDAPREEER